MAYQSKCNRFIVCTVKAPIAFCKDEESATAAEVIHIDSAGFDVEVHFIFSNGKTSGSLQRKLADKRIE